MKAAPMHRGATPTSNKMTLASPYFLWYMSYIRCMMVDDPQPQKIPLIFFRTGAGSEPVREWLKGLPEAERQAIGKDLLRAQWRWPVGMPLCRPLGNGLWEVGVAPTFRSAFVPCHLVLT